MIPSNLRRSGRAHVVVAFALGAAAGWVAHLLYVSQSALDRPAVETLAFSDEGAEDSAVTEASRGPRVPRDTAATAPRTESVTEPALVPGLASEDRGRMTEERLERLRRLTTGEPEERLALAHEVLAETEVGPLTARALSVLVELEPETAVAELLARVEAAEGRPGGLGLSASMIERLGRSEALTAEHLTRFYDAGAVDVQVAAARVAEERGDGSLVERFLTSCEATLAGGERSERIETVRNLSLLRSSRSTELVVRCFDDEAEEVRLQAIRSTGLGQRDPVVIEGLRRLADDPSERVRGAAERQLEMLERMPAIRPR